MSIFPTTKTAGELATYVKRQFGDESGVQITDADIFRWISSAELQIVARIAPIQARSKTDVTANEAAYDLSALPIHQIDSVHLYGSYLPQRNFSEAERFTSDNPENPNTSEQPGFWYSYAGMLYLWPIPARDVPGGLEIFYVKMPNPIENSLSQLTVPDKYFDAIVSWVLSKAYELDEEFEQANLYRQHFENQLLEQHGEERNMANMTYPVITYLGD